MNSQTPNISPNIAFNVLKYLQHEKETTPLKLFHPFNILVFMCFYSPIILIICLVYLSFVFQNFKGLIYLGFITGCLFLRELLYNNVGSNQNIVRDGSICTSIQYSKFGNSSFSAFVFAFTMFYLFIPMFVNSEPNYWIFSMLIVYFFLDIGIKVYKKCILNMGEIFVNVLIGGFLASAIVMAMYAGGSSKYLFFNELSNNKDVCSMPSKQTFKCALYKNGELISGIN